MEKISETKNIPGVDPEKGEGKERPSMSVLLAMPAFLTALTACSDVVDSKNIAEVIKNGEHVEYVSSEQLSALKTSIPELIKKYKDGYTLIKNAEGDDVGVYFPNENLLIFDTLQRKEKGAAPRYRDPRYDSRSYAFQPDGTMLLQHGISLNGSEPYVDNRTIIQEHDGKHVVTFSQMNDFGSKRTYEIGKYTHNQAIDSESIEHDLEEDNARIATALAK